MTNLDTPIYDGITAFYDRVRTTTPRQAPAPAGVWRTMLDNLYYLLGLK
jgi:hypothetical protein